MNQTADVDLATVGLDGKPIVSRNLLPVLLNNHNLQGEGVEIGSQNGFYSERILAHSKLSRLYSVDPWLHQDGSKYVDSANVNQELQDYRYIKTVFRLAKFNARSVVMRMFSDAAAPMFGEASLDFVYIDGDHSKQGCAKDIELWWPKLKPGGVFAGHDYLDGFINNSDFGVKSAVDEFVAENDLQLFVTQAVTEWEAQWPTWYLFKPS